MRQICLPITALFFACNVNLGRVSIQSDPGSDSAPDAGMGQVEPDPQVDRPPGPDPDVPVPELFFAPSNIPETLFEQAVTRLEITSADGLVEIDTDRGTITRMSDGADLRPAYLVYEPRSQIGGPDVAVFATSGLAIAEDARVEVRGSAALVIAVAGDVAIDGVIEAVAGVDAPNQAGPGGFAGGDRGERAGAGPGGGQPSNNDTGGGGGGFVAPGGAGGDRSGDQGGLPGAIVESADLIPLQGGSGGAMGAGADGGEGGGGGGAIQISARGSIAIGATGGINCGGGSGRGGAGADGGGGAGAGGAILLEGRDISVAGVLAANGGGGGAGADGNDRGASGQPGQLGSVAAEPGAGFGEGAAGGAGGAGNDPAGQPGEAATNDNNTEKAGGGGGAGGRIHLRSATGSAEITGEVSPAAGLTESAIPVAE